MCVSFPRDAADNVGVTVAVAGDEGIDVSRQISQTHLIVRAFSVHRQKLRSNFSADLCEAIPLALEMGPRRGRCVLLIAIEFRWAMERNGRG